MANESTEKRPDDETADGAKGAPEGDTPEQSSPGTESPEAGEVEPA